ncbi:gephyrin-like molybdotransferase Glp [Stenoxybacter acetivorans]|uniref:molybdopterin molybdotransferase MoeA n=1 Tax=Stenoxybacter acetivorans TaxID=422441 RepID=UPI00056AC2A8|nr:gephyrin-like molybdotransferase Glp [Stenoxybacter acetivorans]
MMDFYDGLNALLNHTAQADTQTIPLAQAHGLILAEDLMVRQDEPRFDNSAMDGYAVCGLNNEQWQIIGTQAAGEHHGLSLQRGQAVRIFTGAGLPENTDAVVMQENTEAHAQTLTITTQLKAGQNIRRRGESLQSGHTLIKKNTLLNAQAIGLIASQGYAEIHCYCSLRVSVFTTGDELAAAGEALACNQIFDSNRPMLTAQLLPHRFIDIADSGVLPDDLNATTSCLKQAAKNSDVIVIAGGASVGDKDFVKPALAQLGEIEHWKLSIKPGKPFGWGHIGNCKILLLPGNPVAAFVTMQLLGLPLLRRLAGLSADKAAAVAYCVAAAVDFHGSARREFLRGTVKWQENKLAVSPLMQQGSHMLSGCVDADVLIEIPPHADIKTGDVVKVYPV